ncbi:uncharacterized protein LOC118613327 [Rousettus aegyptiacus]|uniref:uncharacterized protein LOC118613327 n=1 Tax=Rousettus aegyptiacus TaxID=9407 RepID=UPI00168D491F|nr:uncharacterized protein LOC118613327 [Rousettus aegyptiacus]
MAVVPFEIRGPRHPRKTRPNGTQAESRRTGEGKTTERPAGARLQSPGVAEEVVYGGTPCSDLGADAEEALETPIQLQCFQKMLNSKLLGQLCWNSHSLHTCGRSAPSLRICFGDLAEALKVKTQVPLDAVDGSGKSRSRTEDNMWHGGCDPHDLPRCLHSLPQAEVEHDDDQRQAVHELPPARAQVVNDMAVLEVQHPMPGVGQTGIIEGHCLPTQNCNPTAEMVLSPTWQDQRPHSEGPGPPAPAEGQGPPDVSWGRWEWHAGG